MQHIGKNCASSIYDADENSLSKHTIILIRGLIVFITSTQTTLILFVKDFPKHSAFSTNNILSEESVIH